MASLYRRSKQLQAYFAEYFSVIVSFCHQIWKFAQNSAINRFVSALSDSDLRTCQSKLESWSNMVKEEMSLVVAKNAQQDSQEISGIKTSSREALACVTSNRIFETNSEYSISAPCMISE
jgi:hypothetical protein